MTPPDRSSRRQAAVLFRDGAFARGERAVPEEAAVAISVNGSTHAVMMATPDHLEELALGLALNEGIVRSPADILRTEIAEAPLGIDCRLWLTAERTAAYTARRRLMTGPVGCGLCGAESLEIAGRDLPAVGEGVRVRPATITDAMAAMARAQALGRQTRAAHAAGFFVPGEGLVTVREDVGRHNALDKVAGHLALARIDPAAGLLAITSRVSVELIQKAAVMGVSFLAAISVPTALAIRAAAEAGITLVAVARGADFEVFTRPERVLGAPALTSEMASDHAA